MMTKNSFSIILGLIFTITVVGQQPVHWSYEVKKIAINVFEIHQTTTLDNGWHLYAQHQPKDAIALPTTIHFTPNPLLVLEGKVKELGNLVKYKEEKLGIEAYQYGDKVEFVQQN